MAAIKALTGELLDALCLSNLVGRQGIFRRERDISEYVRGIQQVIVHSLEYERKGEKEKAIQYTLLHPTKEKHTLRHLLNDDSSMGEVYERMVSNMKLSPQSNYTPIYAVSCMIVLASHDTQLNLYKVGALFHAFTGLLDHMIQQHIPVEYDIGRRNNHQTVSVVDLLLVAYTRLRQMSNDRNRPQVADMAMQLMNVLDNDIFVKLFPIVREGSNENKMHYYPIDLFRTLYQPTDEPNDKNATEYNQYASPIFAAIAVGHVPLIQLMIRYSEQPGIHRSLVDVTDSVGRMPAAVLLTGQRMIVSEKTPEFFIPMVQHDHLSVDELRELLRRFVPHKDFTVSKTVLDYSAFGYAVIYSNLRVMNIVYNDLGITDVLFSSKESEKKNELITKIMIKTFCDVSVMRNSNKKGIFLYDPTVKNLTQLLQEKQLSLAEYKRWRGILYSQMADIGDMYGFGEPTYFFHHHAQIRKESSPNNPLPTGVSQQSFDHHMEKYVEIEDKRAVPCMIDRCTQKLTLAEISALASPGLWVRFYEASTDPTNYSVRSTIDLYNGVLTNERSEDPLGFGMIHHEGICPFCIQPIHREEGCVYMMHEKPNRPGITPSDRPYCLAEYVVKELRDRYYHKARELFLAAGRGVSEKTDELSFCIECGRPCWRHTHFSADGNTFIEPVRKVNGGYDPGKCPGGGVQEKVARILAIREVYSSGKYRDKTQERRVAALAADRAPLQPELMQRAAAVLASKQWNMPLTHHTYESAAHRNMIEEVKNNNMGMMQSASASAENVRVQFNEEDEKEEMVDAARRRGGKHRKTRSQRKGRSRHTRRSKRKTRQAHTKNRRSN